MGDPSKLVLLEPVLQTIRSDDLIERTRTAGETLMSGLIKLQVVMTLLLHAEQFLILINFFSSARALFGLSYFPIRFIRL